MLKRLSITVLLIFAISVQALALDPTSARGRLSGRVYDAQSKLPLLGANVQVLGTILGTVTNLDGYFEIAGIPPGLHNVRISMVGYGRQELTKVDIPAQGGAQVSVAMQPSVIETEGMVITAGKRRQSIEDSPTSVGVMTGTDFEKKNEVYLDKLLEHASGVNFIGSQINIRGSSGFNYGAGSRVLMLIDGVPVMPGDSGDIKWDLVPATQVERVEIIKGAGSALYGSSALGGVVNIITKSTTNRPVTHVRLSAGAYDKPRYQEWRWTDRLLHFDELDVDHSRKIGAGELMLAAGHHQSTGYAQTGHYRRYNASVKWRRPLTANSNLTISSQAEGGNRGSGLLWRSQRNALQVAPEAIGDYVKSDKFGFNLFHQWAATQKLGLKSRFSYFRNYWKNFFHDNITASQANRYGMEIQGDYQFSNINALTFGTEESWDHVNSGLVGAHDQYVLSGYVQNERRLQTNFSFTLGIRYDYQWVDTGFNDQKWSPKAGLVWHAHPALSLRASSGKGFRAASMAERFSDSIYSGLRLMPNPALRSETAWSHEIGLNLRPGQAMILDISGFVSDYWDLIEPQPDETQTIRFINVTRARIAGVETTLKVQPWLANLMLDLGYTYMNPRDLDLNEVLAYRPKHIFQGSLSYGYGIFDASVDYRYISRLELVKLYPADDRVEQTVCDAHVGMQLGSWHVSLHGKNIFNHNHTQMERTLMPIRHYVCTLRTTL